MPPRGAAYSKSAAGVAGVPSATVTPGAFHIYCRTSRPGKDSMTTSIPHLDVKMISDALVLKFTCTDMTDAAFINRLGDEIYQIVKGIENPKVVVDFAVVERLSSATLGMLVALRKIVTKHDGQMRVTNIAKDLIEIFKMTRLDVTLQVCASNQAALDSFE